MDLGFDIISVKQMSTNRRSPSEGTLTKNLLLFLITLSRTAKSQEIFRLTALYHIAIRVRATGLRTALRTAKTTKQFGPVWANCKQPPRCLWCGGWPHAQRVSRERELCLHSSMLQLPVCGERETPSYQLSGLQTRKGELQNKKLQRTPKTTTGRVFSSNITTPGVSIATALPGSTQQQQLQAPQVPTAGRSATEKQSVPAPVQPQKSGQSVRAQNVNTQPLDNMLRVATAVKQSMTEFNGTVSE
jgi:hypothetical protein